MNIIDTQTPENKIGQGKENIHRHFRIRKVLLFFHLSTFLATTHSIRNFSKIWQSTASFVHHKPEASLNISSIRLLILKINLVFGVLLSSLSVSYWKFPLISENQSTPLINNQSRWVVCILRYVETMSFFCCQSRRLFWNDRKDK